MIYVEISKNDNGGHNSQSTESAIKIPDGWAVLPADVPHENFPFGEVEVQEVDGVLTIAKWTPLPIPVFTADDIPPSELEKLRADVDYLAALGGVEL